MEILHLKIKTKRNEKRRYKTKNQRINKNKIKRAELGYKDGNSFGFGTF